MGTRTSNPQTKLRKTPAETLNPKPRKLEEAHALKGPSRNEKGPQPKPRRSPSKEPYRTAPEIPNFLNPKPPRALDKNKQS